MKQFEVYRDMRRSALIFGLPVAGFAGLMGSIILSLLIIIFSFHLLIVVGLVIWNAGLYIALLRFKSIRLPFQTGTYPELISNKKPGLWV